MTAPITQALEQMVRLCQRRRTAPARLRRALRSLGPALTLVPYPARRLGLGDLVAAEWKRDLRSSRARNLVLLAETERAVLALSDAGVETALLKGIAALERLYPDPGLRPMDDADLLIHADDRRRAAGVLQGLGFRLIPAEPGRLGPTEHLNAEWTFRRPLGAVSVEIDVHWRVVADARVRSGCDLDDNALWSRAETIPSDTSGARRLSRLDAVLVTGLTQITGHPWSHPLGYLDMHLLLCDLPRAQWETLVDRARETRLTAPLYWSLRFARGLFNTPVPAPCLDALSPALPARLLGGAMIGGDWLGEEPWRREMIARDGFLAIAAGLRGGAAIANATFVNALRAARRSFSASSIPRRSSIGAASVVPDAASDR